MRKIDPVTNAFDITEDSIIRPYPAAKVLTIPEVKTVVSMKQSEEFTNAICLALLHKINSGDVEYNQITEVFDFKAGALREYTKNLFLNKFKPGQTKKGFGPFFATNLIEILSPKEAHEELRNIQTWFYLVSLFPFINISGFDRVKVVYNLDEQIVRQEKVLQVCQCASILGKYKIIIELMLKAKIEEGFFHPEEWLLFVREFRNKFVSSLDSIIAFSDSVEIASTLTLCNYLRIKNKFMLANSDLLESSESQLILEVDQFCQIGIRLAKAIETLSGPSMTPEIVRYSIRATLDPITNSGLLKLTGVDIFNYEIHSYKDYSLNSSIRGAILIKTPILNRSIMAVRKMDAFGNFNSYSTEYLDHIGKGYSTALHELLQVSNVANFEAAHLRADYAIKGYYSNLSEQELRTIIISKRPASVGIALPFDTDSMLDYTNLLHDTEDIKIVYIKEVDKQILEFDDVIGFKLVDQLVLNHPFIVALSIIHDDAVKYRKLTSSDRSNFFPKLSYSDIYFNVLDDKSDLIKREVDSISVVDNELSVNFDVDYRAILGINGGGNYLLTRTNYVNQLKDRIPLQEALVQIFKDSYVTIYHSREQVDELQNDVEFKRIVDTMEKSLFFKKLGAKVYNHILQEIINRDGLISNVNVSAMELNSITNLALIKLINNCLYHVLGTSEIHFSAEVAESNQVKYRLITGGSYENI